MEWRDELLGCFARGVCKYLSSQVMSAQRIVSVWCERQAIKLMRALILRYECCALHSVGLFEGCVEVKLQNA